MEELLKLRYSGGEVTEGEMDAYELAEALQGFSSFMQQVTNVVHGPRVNIRTVVRGFRRGSFEIELLYRVLSPETVAVFIPAHIEFKTILSEAFKLIKHLMGKPPNKVIKTESGGVAVENNNGQIINVQGATLVLITDHQTGRASEGFVRKPLSKSFEHVEVLSDDKLVAEANRNDANSFVPVDTGDVLTENVAEVFLTIRKVDLEGVARWEFSDGRNHFPAKVEDEDFLAKVHSGDERFGNGDSLNVRLRSTQKRVKGRLKAEYTIEKVLDHNTGQIRQGTFF